MAATTLRTDERVGLAVAVGLHAGLVALLLVGRHQPAPPPVPERMTVTISDDVGLKSTSPEPAARAAPDVAPLRGEEQPEQAPPAPAIKPEPAPPPVPPQPVQPQPVQPRAEPRPQPVPRAQPALARPRPAPRAQPAPATPAAAKPATPAKVTPRNAPPAAQPGNAATKPKAPAGAARVGSDFLKGIAGADTPGTSRNAPAAAIGPAVRSSLASAISRQLKPKWTAPQGADAELLVTVLAFDLNPDGTLAGRPQVVRQEGVTDANRAQAQRHAEQAVRAVQLAAPFDLPAQYYAAWRRVASFRFDKRLSQ